MKRYFVVATGDGFPAYALDAATVREIVGDPTMREILGGDKVFQFSQPTSLFLSSNTFVAFVDAGWLLCSIDARDLPVIVPGSSDYVTGITCAPFETISGVIK